MMERKQKDEPEVVDRYKKTEVSRHNKPNAHLYSRVCDSRHKTYTSSSPVKRQPRKRK